jgi:glycogen debranching enzyme
MGSKSVKKARLRLDPGIQEEIKGPFQLLLEECLRLHRESYLAPMGPFKYPWQDIGIGYQAFPCFGHWDLVHECLNLLPFAPDMVRQQMEMYLGFISEEGQMPGTVYGPGALGDKQQWDPEMWNSLDGCHWSRNWSHPPLWPHLIDDYFTLTDDRTFLAVCLKHGLKNLGWWKRLRSTPDGGFYYLDITQRLWESGVDDGVRFIQAPSKPQACVDATSHMTGLMKHLQRWANVLGDSSVNLLPDIKIAEDLVRNRMWDERQGFFFDIWMTDGTVKPIKSFEGFFPLLARIATPEQAKRLVGHAMDPGEFFAYHPMSTVATDETVFKLDCWRGPAWNSMTYWIMRALADYGFHNEAAAIGWQALERTDEAFRKYGHIFEFYNSVGPEIESLGRKGSPKGPFRDYLGHAPLLAMFRLCQKVRKVDSNK